MHKRRLWKGDTAWEGCRHFLEKKSLESFSNILGLLALSLLTLREATHGHIQAAGIEHNIYLHDAYKQTILKTCFHFLLGREIASISLAGTFAFAFAVRPRSISNRNTSLDMFFLDRNLGTFSLLQCS